MVARFTKDKYGWRCTNVWPEKLVDKKVRFLSLTNALLVNVSRAPRLGFCRRPHTYI
jgi:hypothetical protein